MPRPRQWPPIIARERVFERLQIATESKVTILCAPNGHGKSIALSQWISKQSRPVLLIDMARMKEKRTLAGLMSDLIKRLRAQPLVGPHFDSHHLEMLAATRTFRGYIAIDSFELCAPMKKKEREFFHAMVHLSACRWVISTSTVPSLPVDEWLAYGMSDLAIDEFDLAFTDVEVGALRSAMGLCYMGFDFADVRDRSASEIVANLLQDIT